MNKILKWFKDEQEDLEGNIFADIIPGAMILFVMWMFVTMVT